MGDNQPVEWQTQYFVRHVRDVQLTNGRTTDASLKEIANPRKKRASPDFKLQRYPSNEFSSIVASRQLSMAHRCISDWNEALLHHQLHYRKNRGVSRTSLCRN
ncbi:hypothetical protein HN011_005194 [Eciton burchellii]|nr:hypothetical protein HN011_005194 [Eciton burchellii]